MGWRLLAATLATAVLALAGLVIGASPASAHNVLKSTSPADGKKVARTPSSVVLTFDEPAIALGTKLVITGPEGPVQIGKPSLVDNTVTQDLQPGSPAGAYTVDWRVTSADGHPISGSFTFTAEAAAAAFHRQPLRSRRSRRQQRRHRRHADRLDFGWSRPPSSSLHRDS